MVYKAEYIWIDGTEPTPQIRSKTKVVYNDKLSTWGFDGSSTNQAPGEASDCALEPVFSCPDPIRGGQNKLVLCEVLLPDGSPHESNTRFACANSSTKYRHHSALFGFEQESIPEQGPFYCSVGAGLSVGREIVEEHMDACIKAGLQISGINAEVMPGQWEFQIGPVGPTSGSDQLWIARWLLHRIAEKYDVVASFEPKPVEELNGAGCHTNFSTVQMRESYDACVQACEALGEARHIHVQNYGHGIEDRLTGDHETCSYKEFKYGVSDRGASIRIPWQVARDKKGYIEDRRPNANCDPYIVSKLMLETVCSHLEKSRG